VRARTRRRGVGTGPHADGQQVGTDLPQRPQGVAEQPPGKPASNESQEQRPDEQHDEDEGVADVTDKAAGAAGARAVEHRVEAAGRPLIQRLATYSAAPMLTSSATPASLSR
jgi:hypothetical protein